MMRSTRWMFGMLVFAVSAAPMAGRAADTSPAAIAATVATQGAATSATLSGDAARKSEPGQAVVALFRAAHKNDRAAVRKLLLPDVIKDFDGDPNFVMGVLTSSSDANVSELTIEMEGADVAKGRVTIRQGSSSSSTGMTIRKVDGVWKISM